MKRINYYTHVVVDRVIYYCVFVDVMEWSKTRTVYAYDVIDNNYCLSPPGCHCRNSFSSVRTHVYTLSNRRRVVHHSREDTKLYYNRHRVEIRVYHVRKDKNENKKRLRIPFIPRIRFRVFTSHKRSSSSSSSSF